MSKAKSSALCLFAAPNACPKHQPGTHMVQFHLGFSRLSEATANCTVGHHHWVNTTAVSISQCAICGTRGYCFTCCPHSPQGAASAPCASHGAQGKGIQA